MSGTLLGLLSPLGSGFAALGLGWHLGESWRAIGRLLEHRPPPVRVALVIDPAHLAVRVRVRVAVTVTVTVTVTVRAPYPAHLAVRELLDAHALVPHGLGQRCAAHLLGLGLAANQRAGARLVEVRGSGLGARG